MQLNFTGRKLEITPTLKDFTTEKFQRLEKFITNESLIHLTFELQKATYTAEATVKIHGSDINAKAQSDDIYNAIDELVDKLLGQAKKQKERLKDHRK